MELTHTAVRAGRLSSFLRNEMNMSAGLVNRLKWSQRILVNGKPQHNDFQVSPGDVICAVLDDPQPEYPAEFGDLTILYEDAHLLAVDKPGVLGHVSQTFARYDVSIRAMQQKDAAADGRVTLVFITHKASEQAMHQALNALDSNFACVESVLRVES